MIGSLMKRTGDSLGIVKREAASLLLSAVGLAKVRLFFRPGQVNKLEVGIGVIEKKEGFISSDLMLATDYPFDFRIGLPFPENSIDFIYSEHLLEHFDYDELKNFLAHVKRVLKPDGVFSISIPDARLYLEGYFSDDFDRETHCTYDFGLSYKYKMDYVNYMFYMGGAHKYMFDRESIISVLEDAGFSTVRYREYDPTLDQDVREHESIYVEAVK